MSIEIVTVPCLSDNYAFLIHAGGRTALVDAPEAAPITAALDQRGWSLDEIWITHHHDDHVQALPDLRAGAVVRGSSADTHKMPEFDAPFAPGDTFQFAGHDVQVIEVSGHTIGHVAFYMPDADALFSADSLMALGCGRVFEGTMPQMWDSLSKLAALPPETVVYSGHEYTATNARFALTIEPDNEALQSRAKATFAAAEASEPTVPSRLSDELATNPFLRAGLHPLKASLNMVGAADADVFAEIRRRKDSF